MAENQTIQSTSAGFRVTAISFACVLGSLAAWMLAAEIVRPSEIGFTTNTQSAAFRRDAAVLAARIGVVRGDLWSEAASAYADMPWAQDKSSADMALFEQTKAVTEQAIVRAPHESRLWVLLAANYFRFGELTERATAALKMSYYTGSNTVAVLPQRLLLAVQSRALEDEEFRELVRHDIRVAASRKSLLMPALVAAYKKASPSGKRLLEAALTEFDPSALSSMRSEGERR